MTIFFFFSHIFNALLGQPHAIFRGFIAISGGWTVLCKEFITVEDSPRITVSAIRNKVGLSFSLLFSSIFLTSDLHCVIPDLNITPQQLIT